MVGTPGEFCLLVLTSWVNPGARLLESGLVALHAWDLAVVWAVSYTLPCVPSSSTAFCLLMVPTCGLLAHLFAESGYQGGVLSENSNRENGSPLV